ncbi:hypothetical protein FRB99_002412 [Tulasnella sp. 403]|nr:hypothetical protein FRB99_002412 [Tulasnella sp. 403]
MSRELPDSIECHLPLNLNCSLEEEDALRRGGALPAPLPTQNPTKSFWTHGEPDCNPLAREGSDGDLTLDADVCIVGSGMTGVSCAYHLAQLARQSGSLGKLKVVILEARDFCRNGGHLTNQLWHRMDELVKTYGAEEALKARLIEYRTVTSIVDFVKANNWESAVDLVEGGHISLVFSKEELDATERDIKAAEVAGTPDLDKIEWVSAEDMDKASLSSS